MAHGYIYILINACMPGCLKIGHSTKHPDERAREISAATGVPMPYTVAWHEDVLDSEEVERIVHVRLDEHRFNPNREFFSLPLKDAIQIVAEVSKAYRPMDTETPSCREKDSSQTILWQVEALQAADYVHAHLFSVHRGAILWHPHVTAVFGNDGYDGDNRARKEVKELRQRLIKAAIVELSFGLDRNKYSWTVLTSSDDVEKLFELVWECYPNYPAYQHEKTSAFVELRSYTRSPVKPHLPKG